MSLIGWMYDVAREQSPREDLLEEMLRRSCGAGYNAVGLYLEHRFAYASAPWAAGPGCLTPEVVGRLEDRFRPHGLRIIPFLNTLSHMEGFIRSEGGQWLAEGETGFGGAQICPTRPECAAFARDLVADALSAFDDEWIHLGGDETRQLGQCPTCAEQVKTVGKGGLYTQYFGPLCRFVLERGRRPCLWSDMLIQYPQALAAIPPETVIFDWQYFSRPRDTTNGFRRAGFDVVCCPSIQTFNSGWCFLAETQRNIDEHAEDARAADALGVLVTTWEFSYFTHYPATLPLIYAAGRRLARGEDWSAALAAEGGLGYAQAAELLGNRVPAAAAFLRPGTWRQLRDWLAVRQDPFGLWRAWREEACGPTGDEIIRLCDQADAALPPEDPLRFATDLHRAAVGWVRCAEEACRAYAEGRLDASVAHLEAGSGLLERLRPGLARAFAVGGSIADLGRLDALLRKIRHACIRIRRLPAGPCRTAFTALVHDRYIAGDQAAWMTAVG
jgi:hypothetical protein